MTYILKKKWHPSQVEEVGHVFEEDDKGDKFRLRTNNCHKTKESAEEALKRLLA